MPAPGAAHMSRPVHMCDLALVTLSPRFGVEQGESIMRGPVLHQPALQPGLKPDGTVKVRPVDDMSRCA